MKTILHVDLNSYFATIEQQQNPRLRGKPVGIVKDIGRTCIIAASREAKKFGIKTGSNVYDAKTICPQITLVKADFDKYFHFTKLFFSLIQSFTPEVHLFSLDEAFLDATDSLDLYGSAENLAAKIQNRIYKQMGSWVTASIGISHNYMLAKLAGEYAPKGGYFKITQDNLDEILAACNLTDICGIGFRLAEKLMSMGIKNLLEIRKVEDLILKKSLGAFWGPEVKRIAMGIDSHLFKFLDTNPYMKGVGRTITGFKLCDDEGQIRQIIRNLIEEVTLKIRQMDMAGRHISIFLQGENKVWHRHRTLKYYVRHPDEVFDLLYNGFYKGWTRNFPIIRFGVYIDLLKPTSKLTQCWLPKWEKREQVWKAVDTINQKYGLFNIRSATLLKSNLIRPEVTGFLGDKLYQFRDYE
jgi:DNA polymerase-4